MSDFQNRFVKNNGMKRMICTWSKKNHHGRTDIVVDEMQLPVFWELKDRGDFAPGRYWKPGDMARFADIGWRVVTAVDEYNNATEWVNVFSRDCRGGERDVADENPCGNRVLKHKDGDKIEILHGPTPPLPGDGKDGDFWIDSALNILYGPKINGTW